MATAEENQTVWNEQYNWVDKGDEWSLGWGGPEAQWFGTLFPRIHRFLPTNTILELGPGYGRWTHYLKDYCQRLTVVDLAEKCIEECKQRFADSSGITYHVNDGRSLEMVPDKSVDFVFSFDSLVHADSDALQGYLHQLSNKLTVNGAGFIHHSNLAAYIGEDGEMPTEIDPLCWRDKKMSAALFAQYCDEANLQCVSQEKINWTGDDGFLIDTLSVFTPKGSVWARPNRLLENPRFMDEMRMIESLSNLYAGSGN